MVFFDDSGFHVGSRLIGVLPAPDADVACEVSWFDASLAVADTVARKARVERSATCRVEPNATRSASLSLALNSG